MRDGQKPDLNTPDGRLKSARIKAGYASAAEFARAHELTESTYAAHENGQNGIRDEAAKRYARLLGISVGWLLNAEGPDPEIKKREAGPTGIPDDELLKRIEVGLRDAISKKLRAQKIPLAAQRDVARYLFERLRK